MYIYIYIYVCVNKYQQKHLERYIYIYILNINIYTAISAANNHKIFPAQPSGYLLEPSVSNRLVSVTSHKTKTGQCKQYGGNAMLGRPAFLCPPSPSPPGAWPAWRNSEGGQVFFQRRFAAGSCLSLSSSSLRAVSRDAL